MWVWWVFGILTTLFAGLYALYKYYTGNKDYWPSRKVFLLDFDAIIPLWERVSFKHPFHIMDLKMYQGFKAAGVRSFGGIMEFRTPTLVALDPELIKSITVKDFDHFVNRRNLDMKKTDPLFHDMLISKTGQEWKDLRATLSPTFTTGKIKRMFEVFNVSADKLANFLDKETLKAGDGGGVDMRDGITRFTMDVIASAAFGFDSRVFSEADSEFSRMGKRMQNQFTGLGLLKIMVLMIFPNLLSKLGISIADTDAVNFFAGVLKETIRRREESGEVRNDFIQLLIEAKSGDLKAEEEVDEKESESQLLSKGKKIKLTDHIILSQALLFFNAGFDTIETFLVFSSYEMALNPEIQEKLAEEIKEAVDRNDGKLTYEDVNRMEYLDKVVSESLRKYPPAIRTERKCTQDYKIPNSNFVMKKDSVMIIPMYGIHHDEEHYPNPEVFDPERFSPENKAARHPYAYIPFGTGPRNCIANRFAIIEGKAALAHLIHKFKLEPSSKTDIPLKFSQTIGFKPDSMYLKVTRRDNGN